MWWDELAQAKRIVVNIITWRKFQYFKQNHLSEYYYDKKMQEFFEFKLGNMTMEEYEKKFLELLRYVDYIENEKAKMQQF